jgi:hypothetical protein
MAIPSWDETTPSPGPEMTPAAPPGLPSWDETSAEPQKSPMDAMAAAPKPLSWDETTGEPTETVGTEPAPKQRPPNPDGEPADEQIPGYWDIIKSATSRKATEAAANVAAGGQVVLPEGIGGKTLEQQRRAGEGAPETHDYIDKLLSEDITTGIWNPRWLAAQIGGMAGGMAPGLAAAGAGATAGTVVGGLPGAMVGGIAGFGGEMALEALVPAYKAAIAAGFSPQEAAVRAGLTSGLAAAFAAAMGLVGKVNVTGSIAKAMAGEAAEAMAPQILETMVQLGVVQPSLMAGQDIASTLTSTGQLPDSGRVLTDMFMGGVGGIATHNLFRGIERVQEMRRGGVSEEEAAPPSGEDILQAAKAQRPQPGFVQRLGKGAEPAAPVAPGGAPEGERREEPGFENLGDYHERDVTPAWVSEHPSYFYSQAADVIDKMPERFNGKDLINYLKGRGVKDDEINDLDLRGFLKDRTGQINKEDVKTWIDANQVQVWERSLRDLPPSDAMVEANALYDHNMRVFGPMEQWPPRTRRHFDQVNEVARRDTQERYAEGAKYTSQLLPGLNNDPHELTFRTPHQLPSPEVIEARAKQLRAEELARIEEQSRIEVEQGGRPRRILLRNYEDLPPHLQERFRDDALRRIQEEDPNLFTGSHYSDPNTFAHVRLTYEVDRDGYKSAVIHEVQSDAHQLGAKEGYKPEGKVANLPFKSNWQELVAKRLLQVFADQGVQRVYVMNGDQVGMRLGVHNDDGTLNVQASKAQVAGARMNYEKKFWGALEKWAKKSGSETGTGRFNLPDDLYTNMPTFVAEQRKLEHKMMGIDPEKVRGDMRFVTMSPAIATHIREYGHPLHEKDVGPPKQLHTLSEQLKINNAPEPLLKVAPKLEKIMRRIAQEVGMAGGIEFHVFQDPQGTYRGRMLPGTVNPLTGNYMLETNVSLIHSVEDLYAAMSHELGHAIKEDMFDTASHGEQAVIIDAFRKFRARMDQDDLKVGDVRRMRDNAISEITGARSQDKGWTLDQLEPRSRAYLLHFDEWFSEQVAKWMQVDQRPVGILEKFFKSLANKITKMLMAFKKVQGRGPIAPTQVVSEFLNRRWDKKPDPWAGRAFEQFEKETVQKAQAAVDKEGAPETTVVPQQASTASGREILKQLPPDVVGNGEGMAAHADRMNAFFDLTLSLPQVQQLNRGVPQLAKYTNMHKLAYREIQDIAVEADQRRAQWARLRDPKQQENLNGLIDDYANGRFKLPHTEDGIDRRPNNEEFTALVKKWGVSKQALDIFNGTIQDFDGALEKYRTLLLNDAKRIKDPQQRANNIKNINATFNKQLQRPFYPLSRFGKYLVTVYSHDNKIRHVEQTNSLRQQRKIVEALEKHVDRLPGDKVLAGEVPKDSVPFLGMPPGLLDLMKDKLSLSDTQKAVLDQLRFDYAPGHSFKHQFRQYDRVPGYNTDFMRNYAYFFHHFARHVTRLRWVDEMRDQMRSMGDDEYRLTRLGDRDGAVKLDRITKYMQRHFDAWVNPKNDWAGLRGLMFHWYLGFNPASALVNLTQTPLMTMPYLGSTFGDIKAIASVLRASLNINNYYRKGTLLAREAAAKGGTKEDFIARAMGEMVRQGKISETQAHQLAAAAEDRNLLRNFGSGAEKGWLKFQEASSWMFEMTEQWNRRVAAASALDLAYDAGTSHKAIKEAIGDNPISFQKLISGDTKDGRRWTEQEAGAFLAAMKAIDATQFDYAQYARPRLMTGGPIRATALTFKLFTQNTMFNLMSHPGMLARWMFVMGAMGGLQGLLGYENINSVIKTLGWQLFGKDWDLDDEVRHFAHDVLNDRIGADILLHGGAAKGFGMPAVMHSMGFNSFPTFDVSKSVGFGDPLGFDPLKPLQPTKQPKEEIFRQMERASGAAFGLPMSLYDFAASTQNFSDLKKYEPLIPRFFGNLSHAYRYATQGAEVNRAGNAVVKFDPTDTEQMMEILGRAAGLQPRRLTEAWEKIAGMSEAATYWDLRRQGLMRQFGDAVKKQDNDGKEKVMEAIRNYNDKLPEEARSKAITGKELKASVEQRLKVQQRQEAGLPAQKANIPLQRELEKYYPTGWPKDLQTVKPVQ